MNDKDFEELVNKAVDNLPEDNVKALDNVVIVVEDWPTPDQLHKGRVTHGTLFGLYEGIPKTARGNNYNMVTPDKITIFKGPLTRVAVNDDHLQRLVNNTVWHEVAHHFGLAHDRIHQLEKRAQTKQQFAEEVDFLQSNSLLDSGARHAWFMRQGGVSDVPYFSLNVSFGVGDRPEFAEENIRRALTSQNMDRNRLVHIHRLEHGNKVYVAKATDAGKILDDYDAIITDVADLPLGLNTADCITIFMHDPVKKAVGIAHAGWKGTLVQVAVKTVEAMIKEFGSKPADIVVGLGPSIAQDSYEFGKEDAALFDAKYSYEQDGKYYLDVPAVNLDQLKSLGVGKIDVLGIDTFTDKRFYSFRRDRVTGRHLGVISL